MLMGILFVLLLMGVLVVILSDLFLVTFKAQTQSSQREALVQQVDAMMAHLRRDTWSATQLRVDPSHAALVHPSGETIEWHADAHGAITRTDSAGTKSWKKLPAITFASTGPLLKVTVKTPETSESITFISQQLQAGAK
jgi:hypothetical protein